MKINLPLKFCWLTVALIVASSVTSYSNPLNNNGLKGTTLRALAPVKGVVKDAGTGETLVGVSVSVKGTSTGAQTDVNGAFTLDAKPGDVLVITYLGYVRQEVTLGNDAVIAISLVAESKTLNEVVVTALGVKRSEKSLVYSTQSVSGDQLTEVKTDNLMNSVNGKVAGVTISPSAAGVGGSAKVILRGNRSAIGNNQPLYVIDGVPISNNSNSNMVSSTYGGTPDGGDGISNLNPEDIESLTVLKGATAAALYGSQAANGVIVVTTKKGKAGKATLNFSSSASIDKNAYEPEFQNNYGATSTGSTTSFGPKISGAQNFLPDFFQTGNNFTNNISLSSGSEMAQTYMSYANTEARGVEPGNKLTRNNIDFHEIAKFNKLTVDGNANYITQQINNSPTIGFYTNPLTGLYFFPRGQNILPYKTGFEGPNGANGVPTENWPFKEDTQQNPWWIINRNINTAKRNRILLNASLKYDFTSWLNLQARGSLDRTEDNYDQRYYAGTLAPLAAGNGNGSYSGFNQVYTQKYADMILNFTVPGKSDFKLDGLIGASVSDDITSGINWGSGPGGYGLATPNLFTIQNIQVSNAAQGVASGNSVNTLAENHNQIQSIFGNANLSYKNWIYLTVTARNDWSSNLSYTPIDHYFYPSAGLSFILNQAFTLPQEITYAKVRVSFAGVGNTVQQYAPNPLATSGINGVNLPNRPPYPTLKPEQTNSIEAGTDLRFLNDKLSFSFTYYKTNTHNQSIQITPPSTSGYATGYVNVGNIQNKGIEFTLGYELMSGSDFKWNTALNGSKNTNKVIDLGVSDHIPPLQLTNTNSYQSYIAQGGSYGDIYGQSLQKDAQGRILITAQGLPLLTPAFGKIANPDPKFQLGWNNSFGYKRFNLNLLVDGKFGGQVVSVLQSMLDAYGVSKASGDARDAGGVKINGVDPSGKAVTTIDATKWYTSIGGRNAALGEYVYSATVVRLREVAFGYTLPLPKTNAIKSLRLSVTGRNLIYFYRKAPFDPEVASSTSNQLGGVDVFNQPATRNYGLNLNVTF